MTKYIWITAGLVVLLLALGFKQAPKEPPVERPEETIPEIATETAEPMTSESGNIKVSEPQPQTAAVSPLLVKGEARASGETLQIQLKDESGNLIVEKTVAYAPAQGSEFGSFGELLVFDAPPAGGGVLILSTKNPQDTVTIPILFE